MIAQVKKLAMLVAAIQRTENIMYLWGRILQQKCDKILQTKITSGSMENFTTQVYLDLGNHHTHYYNYVYISHNDGEGESNVEKLLITQELHERIVKLMSTQNNCWWYAA